MPYAADGGELGAFQKSGHRSAISLCFDLGNHRHPVFHVGGLPASRIHEAAQIGDDPAHGADQEMAVVNAVREHVAHFAGGGELFHLPPAEIARVPVLKTLRAEMIRLSDITVL